MRMFVAALMLGASLCTAQAKSDAEIWHEADADLVLVSRWGMCLLDTMGEDQAKGMVYPIVGKIDSAFIRKYGQRATDMAKERFGSNFVSHYYDAAKAEFARLPANHSSHCAAINHKLLALVN